MADLKLFPKLSGALISATAIGSTSHVRLDGGTPVTEGNLQFINLKIAGKVIPVDVAPNTTINVAGLGKVVINEQKEQRAPGVGHIYRVIALHVTLDTARAGLPVGAEIQIGASRSARLRLSECPRASAALVGKTSRGTRPRCIGREAAAAE